MEKRGDIELSFGMIFSIILIAVVIAVGIYAINYFVGLGKCSEVGLFYKDLKEEVDRAWNSEITRESFDSRLPSGIASVCFGSLENGGGKFLEEYNALRRYRNQEGNVFLYPPEKSCDQPVLKVEHIDFSDLGNFECFDVIDGVVKFKLEKESFDNLVKVRR